MVILFVVRARHDVDGVAFNLQAAIYLKDRVTRYSTVFQHVRLCYRVDPRMTIHDGPSGDSFIVGRRLSTAFHKYGAGSEGRKSVLVRKRLRSFKI